MPKPRSPSTRLLVLAAALMTALRPAARCDPVKEINVGVRADVEWGRTHKPTAAEIQKAKEHQSLYVIAQVKQLESPENMVRPVNPNHLAAELKLVLAQNGYREARPDQRPEIFLMVFYGRGWLPNPYMGDMMPLPDGTYSPGLQQVVREQEHGFEEKLQRAGYEKLFITVTALRFPSKAGEKPHRLWKTIMNVDDPDHRDLNVVFPKMLAAGGAFFGQHVDKEEAEVWQPLPEGHVKLGPTTVIEEKKSSPK